MFRWLPTWLTAWIGRFTSASKLAQPAIAPSPDTVVDDSRTIEVPASWNATTAVELIARLMELTTSVADEVEEHGDHIKSINAELSSVKQGDSAAVAAVVCKLLVSNQDTQRRLEQAELKLQAQQRQLQDVSAVARMDSLTGLVNRRSLDSALHRCIADLARKARPATLLMIDVDHFKAFNDAHGHVVGDEALKHVANVIRSQARETDLVARFGGEEFAIVFTGAPMNAVKRRAEKTRASIGSSPLVIDGQELRISASAGLAELREGDDENALIKRADAALYAAKANGRNRLYFDDGNQPLPFDPRAEQLRSQAAEDEIGGDRRRMSTELAAESFADTTFVSSLARRVAEWRRGGAPFSILLARLDRMEEAAADCNHEARQAAMKALGQLARATLRDMDQATCWTDDGLAILLPSARASDAVNVARRLAAGVERYDLPLEQGILRLSFSTGVCEIVEGNDAQRLLERAWLALESARNAGGGQTFLHDGLHTSPARQLATV